MTNLYWRLMVKPSDPIQKSWAYPAIGPALERPSYLRGSAIHTLVVDDLAIGQLRDNRIAGGEVSGQNRLR